MTSPSGPYTPTIVQLLRHAAQRFAGRDYVVTPDSG